jgi:hypothetical protein
LASLSHYRRRVRQSLCEIRAQAAVLPNADCRQPCRVLHLGRSDSNNALNCCILSSRLRQLWEALAFCLSVAGFTNPPIGKVFAFDTFEGDQSTGCIADADA